jgi:hypothetical protein
MRLPSITDQILIKAQRIRSIQEKGKQMIDEGIESEFIGIINYCIIAIIQLGLPENAPVELEPKWVLESYGEAWREMRVSSITDIILMKLHRVKQIEDNQGKTLVSEGLDANYRDMLNYSVFALIRSGFKL